ncbi:MAG: Fe-S cluster assembly protein SufD [Bacteroidales bacterium]|jgi:Fe-S cluster assembly protein SufD|nr:Fe-S cluster assembly protein SufD [Bacteroidales bacterium]
MTKQINEIPMLKTIPQWFENIVEKDGQAFSGLQKARTSALEDFNRLGFPHKKLEKWRSTDIKTSMSFDYSMATKDFLMKDILEEVFECDVKELDSYVMNLYKGRFVYKEKPLHTLSEGVIVGSLSAAFDKYPELVKKHFGKFAKTENNAFNALNTALFLDGLFVYVPKNVTVEKPLQLINAVGTSDDVFVQNRNLVILEENSQLTLIHCDDSYNYKRSFTNSVTEIILGANASLDHYRLQNINNNSSLISSVAVEQARDSRLSTNSIILNGGLIRNETYTKLNGEGAHADILGVYLADKNQHIDNQVFVDHAVPNCTSNELFKGILDDYARAVFNGHILVRRDAQKTLAYQNNANIILTDKAMINTKPFLEIYADDVKCSHGATVGQLDESALFYIRQRGISEDNARMLLMYAFAAEVTQEIKIDSLRDRIEDMVKKRLRGELSICDQCVLQCSSPEKYNFEIDMSKI